LENVPPPTRDGEGDGDSWRSEEVVEWFGAKKGAERSSGYDWKNKGPKVVPKNAPYNTVSDPALYPKPDKQV